MRFSNSIRILAAMPDSTTIAMTRKQFAVSYDKSHISPGLDPMPLSLLARVASCRESRPTADATPFDRRQSGVIGPRGV